MPPPPFPPFPPRKQLKAKLCGKVKVVDCMVDRVCTGLRVHPNSVEVAAEPWRGSIVVLEPSINPRNVPFSSNVVTLPKTAQEVCVCVGGGLGVGWVVNDRGWRVSTFEMVQS